MNIIILLWIFDDRGYIKINVYVNAHPPTVVKSFQLYQNPKDPSELPELNLCCNLFCDKILRS